MCPRAETRDITVISRVSIKPKLKLNMEKKKFNSGEEVITKLLREEKAERMCIKERFLFLRGMRKKI